MKYAIREIVPDNNAWVAYVEAKGGGLKFRELTPNNARDTAQRYCDEKNAAEVKAPEGFIVSDKPGPVDMNGNALAYGTRKGAVYCGFHARHPSSPLHPGQVWIVPETKKETREEAERRFYLTCKAAAHHERQYLDLALAFFLEGAGFES